MSYRFDVSIMDSVRFSGGPLLVEIERMPGTSLGILLSSSMFNYSIYASRSNYNNIYVGRMRSASIAERWGDVKLLGTRMI